jgi:3-deoxy-D-manno-octulosonic-acid transferase
VLVAFAGAVLARYIRFVYRSSRQTPDMTERLEDHHHHHPCIIAMWHGQFMMLPLIKPPGTPADVMLARHADAEIMAATLRHFDMELIRGAGAGGRKGDRGGQHAFRAAVEALRNGRSVAMTADVPPGPPRKAGLGIVLVARMAGRPILPVAIATSRYVALNTWSRLTINLPFARVGFAVGEPISVPRTASGRELETLRQAVEDSLNAATIKAYARAGADPRRATPVSAMPAPTKPGLQLGIYRTLTSLARPAAPLLLSLRERRGKEDPLRRRERLGEASKDRPTGRLIWLHAASVGETNAVLPLIAALRQERPSLSFLLTTGTVTSARLAADRLGPSAVHQFVPLDAPEYVARFLDHWRPDFAIFTESEIWPNLILESSARSIPMALINARMSKRSFRRWRRNPGFARPLFGRFELVLAQNEGLARRFAMLGARNVLAVGNLKVDAPPPPVDKAELERLKAALGDRALLVAASTHDGEEQIVAAAHCGLKSRLPKLCTIIAPRHPERGPAVAGMLTSRGFTVGRRSQGDLPTSACDAFVVDTIGELGLLYKLAPVAFIGGSLVERGGQNPIEAVRQGAAVLTGPHWHNFADAYRTLLNCRGAIEVRSAEELAQAAHRLLTDEVELSTTLRNASTALAALTGALPRTVEALLPYLPSKDGLRRAS